MSVEAIHKGSVSEMWSGITWNVSTRLGSRTRNTSTTRALPSLSVQALKAPPTMPEPYTDSQRSTPCAIPVLRPKAIEWSKQEGEGAARCPPCSQNAHDKNVLVRCAQLRAALAIPLEEGIGKEKALARDKASLGALRAEWVRTETFLSILRNNSPARHLREPRYVYRSTSVRRN